MTKGNYLFHVHTYRCGHAENVPDEEYIRKAIEIGADSIWFSDHAPFPGDPFENRMSYDQLPEYLSTLGSLKERYKNKIGVHIGLEIEYFPSFDKSGYYLRLKSMPGLEFLLLGQHMAELQENPTRYSFSMPREWLIENEFKVLGQAEINGIRTGYFDYIAHPDRIFRRRKKWTSEMQGIAERIIASAKDMGIPLEQNESSKRQKHHYWAEFWECTNAATITIHGLDAHSVKELKLTGEKSITLPIKGRGLRGNRV